MFFPGHENEVRVVLLDLKSYLQRGETRSEFFSILLHYSRLDALGVLRQQKVYMHDKSNAGIRVERKAFRQISLHFTDGNSPRGGLNESGTTLCILGKGESQSRNRHLRSLSVL